MAHLLNYQCIILTTPPMRSLCGETGKRMQGITLATLKSIRSINHRSAEPVIRVRLCAECRSVARDTGMDVEAGSYVEAED